MYSDNYNTPKEYEYEGEQDCSFCKEPLIGSRTVEVHEASGEHFATCLNCNNINMIE